MYIASAEEVGNKTSAHSTTTLESPQHFQGTSQSVIASRSQLCHIKSNFQTAKFVHLRPIIVAQLPPVSQWGNMCQSIKVTKEQDKPCDMYSQEQERVTEELRTKGDQTSLSNIERVRIPSTHCFYVQQLNVHMRTHLYTYGRTSCKIP